MKLFKTIPIISQACRSKAGFLKAGVTACAITLATGLVLHPHLPPMALTGVADGEFQCVPSVTCPGVTVDEQLAVFRELV